MVGSIIGWIVFGLIVGAIARFFMPGPQPMGFILTTLLGIGGSFLGGYIGSLWHGQPLDTTQPAQWIGSILGALLILLLYGFLRKRPQV